MVWTVDGVVVADNTGWTAGASGRVIKRKKWANGAMNSGPTGKAKRFRPPNRSPRSALALTKPVRPEEGASK